MQQKVFYANPNSKIGDKDRVAKCSICWDGKEIDQLRAALDRTRQGLREIAEHSDSYNVRKCAEEALEASRVDPTDTSTKRVEENGNSEHVES